jgi:heat-inducible transcriptional repressor
MNDLSERQIKILRAIIEEYMKTASPVGSETLDKKFGLGVSPATLRNEMAGLVKKGYLSQPHTSAGRLPTPLGIKFYVKNIMEEERLSVSDEVAVKEKVWEYRFDFDKLMRATTKALAERTSSIALALTDEGETYSAGYANILDMPEFYDIDVTRTVLSILDQVDYLKSLFQKSFSEDPVQILLADELEREFLEPCSVVFTHFGVGAKRSGCLGVIGPMRLNYSRIIPSLKYFSNLISEISRYW